MRRRTSAVQGLLVLRLVRKRWCLLSHISRELRVVCSSVGSVARRGRLADEGCTF